MCEHNWKLSFSCTTKGQEEETFMCQNCYEFEKRKPSPKEDKPKIYVLGGQYHTD